MARAKISGAAVVLCCGGLAWAQTLSRFEAVEPHMGTLFRITLYAADADRAKAGFRAAFERIESLDNALSDYKPDSELMRLCRAPAGERIAVSADLFTVLDASQLLSRDSDGAFDITLGPVIRLWREARAAGHMPDSEAIRRALDRSGYRNLFLDPATRTARLAKPGMLLDLGAIAKGYAADEALAILRQMGIASALVAASGDLAVGAAPPGKPGWRVGMGCSKVADAVVTIHNAAISTSGDTEQFLEAGGARYSHIIDPRTGMGLVNGSCVTVVSDRGIHADSLATAASVLAAQRGRDAAFTFVQRHPPAACRIAQSQGRHRDIRSNIPGEFSDCPKTF